MTNEETEITAQELFNAAVLATINQGVRCTRLRAQDGRRCAVGHLMTDDEIDAAGIFGGLRTIRNAGLLPSRFEPHYSLLVDLQNANDMALDSNFTADFRARAEQVARIFGLDMPEEA